MEPRSQPRQADAFDAPGKRIVGVGGDHAIALRVLEQMPLGIEVCFVATPPSMACSILDLGDYAALVVGIDAHERVPVWAEVGAVHICFLKVRIQIIKHFYLAIFDNHSFASIGSCRHDVLHV